MYLRRARPEESESALLHAPKTGRCRPGLQTCHSNTDRISRLNTVCLPDPVGPIPSRAAPPGRGPGMVAHWQPLPTNRDLKLPKLNLQQAGRRAGRPMGRHTMTDGRADRLGRRGGPGLTVRVHPSAYADVRPWLDWFEAAVILRRAGSGRATPEMRRCSAQLAAAVPILPRVYLCPSQEMFSRRFTLPLYEEESRDLRPQSLIPRRPRRAAASPRPRGDPRPRCRSPSTTGAAG